MLYMKGGNTVQGLCSYVCWAIAKSRKEKTKMNIKETSLAVRCIEAVMYTARRSGENCPA